MSNLKTLVKHAIPLLLGIGIIILLLLRVQVATGRFFDIDEYTHMHWASQIFHGQKPYIDFFTFFPPLFHWTLIPLFVLFPKNPDIFIAGRFLSILSFVGILVILTIFFARLRSVKFALLPALILAFLPMPYDKYFEIRPDTLSTMLGFLGVLLLSLGWEEMRKKKIPHDALRAMWGKENRDQKWERKIEILFLSAGIIFALCVLVLPKSLPFVMVAGAVVVGDVGWRLIRKKIEKRKEKIENYFKITRTEIEILRPLLFLILGGGIIGVLFFLWMLSLGDFGTVWYSLMKLGVESNGIGKMFIMEPHLFFFPNSSFYGGDGLTMSLIVNHTIWVFAIFVATYRLFTPFLTKKNGKTTVIDELILGGIFFASVYGYIYFFPLKHTQYLIPIGVFIAFYAADGMVSILNSPTPGSSPGQALTFPAKAGRGVSALLHSIPILCMLLLIWIGVAVNQQLNERKLWWKNGDQQAQYAALQKTVPADAKILDLEGKMLDWHDGYFVCCLAFGQFGYLLSHPLPLVSESLAKNNVTYVFQGDSGRLNDLPPEGLWYVKTYFTPVPGWGEKLWKRK